MCKCPICLTNTDKILTNKLRRGEGIVYYCKNCDLGFLDKKIENIKEYYDKEYREEYSHKAEKNTTHAKEIFDIYKNYQKDRLDILNKYTTKKESLLEVGSSAGQFLSHLKDEFKVLNGIELDSLCCEFVKNNLHIDVDNDFLESSKFNKKEFYDTVCSFQVLEHTSNPVEFLKSINSVLKKDGKAFIEVPNLYDPLLSVWNVPSYNTFYYHSAHTFYFSYKSLLDISNKAGFKIIDTIYLQDYNILNHLNWIMNDSPQGDCKMGLDKPLLEGRDDEISDWLNDKIQELNKEYFKKLSNSKKTSNIMVVLEKV